jgi:hypothetical protein
MNRISSETTHIARTALATLHEARTTAETACQAYQMTLAQEQRSSARTDRVPMIVAGPPRAALEIAVAMLATCDAAAALALELSLAFAEASQVAALTAAVASTSRSASIGVSALKMQGPDHLRRQLAHASALASHQVADVLDLQGTDPAPGKYLRRKELGLNGFPLPWRAVVTGLSERLACREVDEQHDASRASAAAAHDAAERVLRAYEEFRAAGRADGALRRYARIAVLASAYSGWAALEMPVDASRRDVAPLPPIA